MIFFYFVFVFVLFRAEILYAIFMTISFKKDETLMVETAMA